MVPAGLMPDGPTRRSCSRATPAARPPSASPWSRTAGRSKPTSAPIALFELRGRCDDAAPRVAVVGSGVAGLVAAHVASRTAHVTLFEADARLGGHADTHAVRPRTATSRSTPASSCTTSAPTRCCCASSPSSAWRPRSPRCRCPCRTSAPVWSTPARWGLAASSPPAATWRDRRTSGCSWRSRASTAGPGRCSRRRRRDRSTRRDAARLPGPRPLHGVLPAALHGAAGRRGVVHATPTWRWTTRPATSSRSCSTTGCSASSGRRSGAP